MAPAACNTGPVTPQRTRKYLLDSASVALIPLRPLSVGEAMDAAFLIVRRNARSLLGLPFAVVCALSILYVAGWGMWALMGEVRVEIATILLLIVQFLLLALVTSALMMWLSGVLTRASLQTAMGEGFAPPTKLTLRQAMRWFLPMLAIALLMGAYLSLAQSVGSIGLLLLQFTLLLNVNADELTLALQALAVMVGGLFITCWLYSWVSVAIPAYVAEGPLAPPWVGRGNRPTNVVMAFVRSMRLVGWKGSFRVALTLTGTVFGLLLAAAMVFVGCFLLLLMFIQALQIGADGADLIGSLVILMLIAIAIGVTVVFAIGIAYVSSLQTLLYLDLRMRREGLDLALRFESVPVPQPNQAVG